MNGLVALFATFVFLFLIRVPIAIVLLAAAIVGLIFAPTAIPIATLPTTMWQGLNHFVLLAIPFFILMGDLALLSGVTSRIVKIAQAFVGHISGGLAHVSVLVNLFMSGMSGSDLADVAATGRLLIPAMKQSGYPAGYAASIIGGSAMIAGLIPPSICFILFSSATNVSVSGLFLAGAIPGVVLGLLLMLQAYVTARRNGYPRTPRVDYLARFTITAKGAPVLIIPVVVLGSILGGIATPTEAAVFGVVSMIVVGGILYRNLSFSDVARQMVATTHTVGSIFFLIAAAAVFARVLTLYSVADSLAAWITSLTTDPVVFLIFVNILFLLLGSILDTVPIILVFVPLLMPAVTQLGIDPIHFGVITVFNLLIGLLTPPYWLTMFLVCKMANISLFEFWRYMWPIFAMMIFGLGLITFIPALSTWLPGLLLSAK